ncbi:hypothetical protein V8G54_025058 [Vigna mungo]|uniref:Uncharacterized protein n=1 Tax=Vigna mungo TaxID=3915 RepID=A0AAQ3N806_VIGMU
MESPSSTFGSCVSCDRDYNVELYTTTDSVTMNTLLRSTLRTKARLNLLVFVFPYLDSEFRLCETDLCLWIRLMKHNVSSLAYAAVSRGVQENFLQAPLWSRSNSTESSLKRDDSANEVKSGPGHSMLAPFTAGWQSTDLHPLVIEKSEGSYVYDTNGKKYLDALAGLWATALGGSESRLVDAAVAQLKKLPFYHSFWNRTTVPSLLKKCLWDNSLYLFTAGAGVWDETVELAKELLEIFTARKMAKAFFVNSGSEANDTQVKLVWYYNNALGRPNKKKFIARAKSLPALHQKFDLPAPFVLHTDCPHYWRYHLPGETEEEFSTRLANSLEQLILKEGPETIAAFIAEPVMGAGGVIPPPATYFEKVQAVVKKYDILFIADEVICAFGRLGTMFGCDRYNIKPDLVSLAKALSSAYLPIGAVLVSPEVSEVIHAQSNKLGSFSHGFTYSGHPVACAVAIEALKIYKERNIVDQVSKISQRFQDGIRTFSDSPIIGEIRGVGLILGTEFTDNKSPNDPFPSEWGIGAYFGAQCEKHGMLVRVAGDNIMMSPPYIISPEEVETLISIYGKALKETEKKVQELKSQRK